MALSTVFHSINSPDNSPLSHSLLPILSLPYWVPAGSPLRGGDVAAYVFNISQPSLPTPFYSVLVTVSVFMALLTAFHSINSPDKSLLSHSVLPVSFLPYWSFMKVSLSPDIILCG